MDMATRWTTARQLFGLSYYRAGQLQAPCSALEEVPEPRPTNPGARSGYYFIVALCAAPGWLRSDVRHRDTLPLVLARFHEYKAP